ncbi:MAG: 4Fe-4S single cluster domain-containing protein [Bacteroidales bacterium]|jgi:anaerobic ribonucleoside-triphosphate reductase activating protein|nr:4Fe-4S single cluster domain-containing protein [Tenuifilaceae bacterium]
MNWQLNKIQYPIYNLGEGKRIGIWVQGCSLGCKGCVNKTLWNNTGGKSISIVDLFNWVVSFQNDFNGITISGGEPFQQYEQLIAFLHLIKSKTYLNAVCFTGYYFKELVELFPDKLFLKYIDTLIDGRYIDERHDDSNLKGSLNQTIYRFVNGEAIIESKKTNSTKWSINIDCNNQIYMAGIPKNHELERISHELEILGIHKKFR